MLLRDARRGSKTKEKREGATASKVREEAASRAGAGGGGGERGLAPSVTSTGGRAYVGLPLKVIGHTVHFNFMRFPHVS